MNTKRFRRAALAALLLLPVLGACSAPAATPSVASPTTTSTRPPTETPVPPETPTLVPRATSTPDRSPVAVATLPISEPAERVTATPTPISAETGAAPAATALPAQTPIATGAGGAPTATPVKAPATARPPVGGVVLPPSFTPAASIQVTINIDSTYPRSGPSWDAGPVGRMLKWSTYPAIARDTSSQWFLVQDGTSRQWLHGSMMRAADDLGKLPIAESGFSPGVLAPARVASGLPAISARARQLYAAAVAAGRDAGMATVIGDCNSEWQVFFGRFASGGYSLAASGASFLQPVVNQFSRSFYRASLATHGSFNAAAALDPTWSDPAQCQAGESPLACEIRVSKASVVIIALGTGDQFTWQSFEGSLRAVIDQAILARTVPVLMTKADDLESLQGGAPSGYINDAIRRLGAQYSIPVIDLWQATRGLPQNGLAREVREDPNRGVVDQGAQRFHLSDDGMNARILLTLQTLNALAR